MKRVYYIFMLLLFPGLGFSQIIQAEVILDAQQTGRNQLSIFNTLERDLREFINNTQWTSGSYKPHERIKCSFNLIIQGYDSDNFQATLQVQSSRPVFGSTMNSILLNVKDNDFNFTYKEFEPLNYNPNVFTNNLISTISFYIYTILGYDADTFVERGGDEFYEEARKIVNAASQRGGNGWADAGPAQSRFGINRDLLSGNFSNYRKALYIYHRQGLDLMHKDVEEGKQNVLSALNLIAQNARSRANAPLFRMFFDAKSDEIMQILNGGPTMDIKSIVGDLNQIAPVHNRKWRMIDN